MAELAAMRVPAVLVPFPAATGNHQFHNAQAFEKTGAARMLEQQHATPELLSQLILGLVEDAAARSRMCAALDPWHRPDAAEQIAQYMVKATTNVRKKGAGGQTAGRPPRWHPHQCAIT